jgi:hypothetical protein
MSAGTLVVFLPGKPKKEIPWTHVEKGFPEPSAELLNFVMGPGNRARSQIMYRGKERTAYFTEEFNKPTQPYNTAAAIYGGHPFYGPFVINVVTKQ